MCGSGLREAMEMQPILTEGLPPPPIPDYINEYINFKFSFRPYTEEMLIWDLTKLMEEEELKNWENMWLEFDVLSEFYFENEDQRWGDGRWRVGWKSFIEEFGDLIYLYFDEEEEWD